MTEYGTLLRDHVTLRCRTIDPIFLQPGQKRPAENQGPREVSARGVFPQEGAAPAIHDKHPSRWQLGLQVSTITAAA
jgi:hypothetical protein